VSQKNKKHGERRNKHTQVKNCVGDLGNGLEKVPMIKVGSLQFVSIKNHIVRH